MDLAASATFAAEAEADFMRLPPRQPKQPFVGPADDHLAL